MDSDESRFTHYEEVGKKEISLVMRLWPAFVGYVLCAGICFGGALLRNCLGGCRWDDPVMWTLVSTLLGLSLFAATTMVYYANRGYFEGVWLAFAFVCVTVFVDCFVLSVLVPPAFGVSTLTSVFVWMSVVARNVSTFLKMNPLVRGSRWKLALMLYFVTIFYFINGVGVLVVHFLPVDSQWAEFIMWSMAGGLYATFAGCIVLYGRKLRCSVAKKKSSIYKIDSSSDL